MFVARGAVAPIFRDCCNGPSENYIRPGENQNGPSENYIGPSENCNGPGENCNGPNENAKNGRARPGVAHFNIKVS